MECHERTETTTIKKAFGGTVKNATTAVARSGI
jgi:hypothetical protein